MPACLQIPLSGHDPLAFSLSYEGGGNKRGLLRKILVTAGYGGMEAQCA